MFLRYKALPATLIMASCLPFSASAYDGYYDYEPVTPFYFSGSFGIAKTDAGLDDFNRRFVESGINSMAIDATDSRFGWRIGAGYQLTNELAFQAGYLNLGEVDVSFDGKDTGSKAFYQAINQSPQSGAGAYANIRYGINLTDTSQLYGSVGAFRWTNEYQYQTGNREPGQDATDGVDIFYGMGMNLKLAPQWRLKGQAEAFRLADNTTWFFSLGIDYLWGFASFTDDTEPYPSSEEPRVILEGSPTHPRQDGVILGHPRRSPSRGDGVILDSPAPGPSEQVVY